MDHLEQENRKLKKEVVRLAALMESVIAAQNQLSPTPATPQQRTLISEIVTTPVPMIPASESALAIPVEFSWGMPPNFMPEGYAPTFATMLTSISVMSVPPPVMHTLPRVEETIYHFEPSEGPDVYEKMDEMKGQLLELRKELKTLRDNDQLLIRYFQDSLTGVALQWYMGLYSASLRTFNDLGEAFVKK
ncbi:uncharacterized protein LOC127137447 [Lathyrus oleraceus]|uniref:uncharacterized protein LOC127137447 n=1 Tax=Pisum sativum TaxID=3888 RepID=UPI0021D2B236|nr:uncharacterized protein LOC127137447 [Pisum sativum]